jgi:hypothetical protein
MKIAILLLALLSTSPHLSWAGAVQGVQQKKAYEEAMLQKAIVERQMMEQVQMEALQRALTDQAMQQHIYVDPQTGATMIFAPGMEQPTEIPPMPGTQVLQSATQDHSPIEQVSDIQEVLSSLEHSSRIWPLIADKEPKAFIVNEYIGRFRAQGAVLRLPPEHYVDLIDAMTAQDPQALDLPFAQIMQVVAVLEYDFDNGQNKDTLAQQILGREAFIANRERLGL